MKRYYYSSALLTVVRAKWTFTTSALLGLFIGTLLLFGVMRINHSVEIILVPKEANTLDLENEILRQQISLIAPRITRAEAQADLLVKRANELNMLFQRPKDARDTTLHFPSASRRPVTQSVMAAIRSPRP